MQSSVRAVEAYRRCRLIDAVTSDEDKVAPVYRLDEICATLRGSPIDVVHDMLDHTLKRLEHKSPIVKQKTLRLIKYAAGKGGSDFRREMQRQAAAVRKLSHYKGQSDALKGDALNKAVRDTAHEAISAIFGSDERPNTMEEVGKRIQGFGNTSYDLPSDDRKSLFSGLVGFGSSSLRQSLNMISGSSGSGSGTTGNSAGGYRGQSLRRSLTTERDRFDKEDTTNWSIRGKEDDYNGTDPIVHDRKSVYSNGGAGEIEGRSGTAEEILLDGLTAPGGVRLQPSRDSIQSFLNQAPRLEPGNLVRSLEAKLKAHSWQVRFKALCVLEACIRQRDGKVLDVIVEMFQEDATVVADCLQSPQASLREKAKKILDLLGAANQNGSGAEADISKLAHAELPDLIDTREMESITEAVNDLDLSSHKLDSNAGHVQSDLLGNDDWFNAQTSNEPSKEALVDPFVDKSLDSGDTSNGNNEELGLFSGLQVDSERREGNGPVGGSGRFESSGNSTLFEGLTVSKDRDGVSMQNGLADLYANLSSGSSLDNHNVSKEQQSMPSISGISQQSVLPYQSLNQGNRSLPAAPNIFGLPLSQQNIGFPMQAPGMPFNPQMMYLNSSVVYPTVQSNIFLQHALASGAMNLASMSSSFAHPQLGGGFPAMPRYPGGGVNSNNTSSNYGDVFDFSSDPTARFGSAATEAKDEDNKTKAFDFISDHVSAALGPKKS